MQVRRDSSLTAPVAPTPTACVARSALIARTLVTAWLVSQVAAIARADEGEINKVARLDFIKRTLSDFEIQTDSDSATGLMMSAEPALWYTNPVRSARGTGATFFWHVGERPAAVVSLSIRDGGKVFRELSLLQDTPLRATRKSKLIWSPRRLGKPWVRLPDAPTPAQNKARRLIQMRSLARRFDARLVKEDVDPAAIRVLPQPLYRYDDPQAGLIDAAVFAFVEATDPEALLLLEANTSDAGGSWRYTLARMTSIPTAVSLDGQEIWKTKGYWVNPRSREDAYVEAYDSNYKEQ